MNKCTDKKLGNRLYAYEAGLLAGPELEEIELHLLACKFCNDRAQVFRDEAQIIRHDPDIRKAVAGMADIQKTSSWYHSPVIRTALAVAAVLVFLLLRPWQLEFRSTQEALAGENRLAVFHFDNLSDPGDTARLGEILANLIIADISGFSSLKVVSGQHLQDVIQRLDSDPDHLNGPGWVARVARETQSRWTLTGSIINIAPTLAVATQLSEAATGDVLAAHLLEGSVDQTIFSMIDSLTVLIRHDLSLPESQAGYVDFPVAHVTTNSSEAYRLYLEGLDYYSKYFILEAAESFAQAIEYDSTFAMAYYYLAHLKDRAYLDQAVRYADRATSKERLYIESFQAAAGGDVEGAVAKLEAIVAGYPDEKQAWYELGLYAYNQSRHEDAASFCRRALELDPFYKLPYNTLAYTFSGLGKVDSALWAIDAYIRLAPDEPNPHDTRGDICVENGKLDEAITSYARAVEIKRDFSAYATLTKLGEMYLVKGDYTHAREIFQEIATGKGQAARSRARTSLALIPLQRGKLDSAMRVLDDGIAADRLELATSGAQGDRAGKHYLKATVYREKNQLDSALDQVRSAIAVHNEALPNDQYSYRYFLAQALAECGKIDSARQVATALKEYLERNGIDLSCYWYSEGCIRLAEGQPAQAAAAFEQSVREYDVFYRQFLWADALIASEQFDRAVRVLTAQLDNYTVSRRRCPIWSVRCHYQLGLAYEKLGQDENAIVQYRLFLSQWAEADPDLAVLSEVRFRLTRLTVAP